METGKLENQAFINRAMGLANPATRWWNSALGLRVGDRRGDENSSLLPLSWKVALGLEKYRCFSHFRSGKLGSVYCL